NENPVWSKMGRLAVHWSRPLAGTPETLAASCEADGWAVAIVCAAVPTQPLPPTGQETGNDLAKRLSDAGWSAFLTILCCTAACAGRAVLAMDLADTSQTCWGQKSARARAAPAGTRHGLPAGTHRAPAGR